MATKYHPQTTMTRRRNKADPRNNRRRNPTRKRRRNAGRRKNMSTAGKIAVGVGIALVAVPIVMLAVGAVVIGKIATKAIDDFPTIPPPTPTPVYPTEPVYPGMS